jgi:hypothetical protein
LPHATLGHAVSFAHVIVVHCARWAQLLGQMIAALRAVMAFRLTPSACCASGLV